MKSHIFSILCIISIQSSIAQNTDINWLKKINGNRNPNLDKGVYTLSQSVYPISLAVPLTELAVAYHKRDRQMRANAFHSVISLAGATITTTILKKAVKKERPYDTYLYIQNYVTENSYSFPSGHTTAAFTTATTLTLHYPKWYVAVPAFTYAGAIGYSRMHLGVHYPSDVAIGAGIGIASALITHKLQKLIRNSR